MQPDQGNTMLPTVGICGVSVTRLICGGNPGADAVVVGVFQKYKNQVAEDARLVREILEGGA
jgi:hypothetical protein